MRQESARVAGLGGKQGQAARDAAVFAAGCFWGVQDYLDQIPGVLTTEAGYTGGQVDHPTYEQVCGHTTGHAEAVKITFDPQKVSFQTLLEHFFRLHDPTQLNRQGPDIGDNYRSAIFYQNNEQKQAATKMIERLNKSGEYKKPIATKIEKAGRWWPAEAYHQNFVKKTGRGACHVAYAPL